MLAHRGGCSVKSVKGTRTETRSNDKSGTALFKLRKTIKEKCSFWIDVLFELRAPSLTDNTLYH